MPNEDSIYFLHGIAAGVFVGILGNLFVTSTLRSMEIAGRVDLGLTYMYISIYSIILCFGVVGWAMNDAHKIKTGKRHDGYAALAIVSILLVAAAIIYFFIMGYVNALL